MSKRHSWLIAIGFALIAVSIISDTVDQNKIKARLDNLEAEQQQAHYWDSLGNVLTCELEARLDSLIAELEEKGK